MKRTPTRTPVRSPQRSQQHQADNMKCKDDRPSERQMQQDIERILTRLNAEIPEAKKEMDALLSRLRTSRIVNTA